MAKSPPSIRRGSGGMAPGSIARVVNVSGFGTQTYYLYLPSNYTPAHAWPLMLALHGAGGAGTSAASAQAVRNDWSSIAEANGIIVVAPIGTNSQGGWSPSSDVPIMSAQLDDAIAHYNVDQYRVYLWGFSAGAHLAHALGLTNTDYFAAYGVSAGSLTQYLYQTTAPFHRAAIAIGGDLRKIPSTSIWAPRTLCTTYGAGDDDSFRTTAGLPVRPVLHTVQWRCTIPALSWAIFGRTCARIR